MDTWDFKMIGVKDRLDCLILKEKYREIKNKENPCTIKSY